MPWGMKQISVQQADTINRSGLTWTIEFNDNPVGEIVAEVDKSTRTLFFTIRVPPSTPEFSVTTVVDRTYGA